MTDERLLVVGSGLRVLREYALAAMAGRAEVVLLSDEELSWQEPYVSGFRRVATIDPEAIAATAHDVGATGLVTYDEQLVELVAVAAAVGGIAHTDAAAIRTCRDKYALRQCLAAHDLSPVAYDLAQTPDEAVAQARQMGYPLVVKPRALGGSIGVVRVDDEQVLRAAFDVAASAEYLGVTSAHAGVLLEEYLDGPEFSVDCVTWKGVTVPLVVAEKRVGFAPYFEEIGHLVPARPDPELDRAVDLVMAAHRAAGLDRLATHTEVKLTPAGPRLIELNVRLGGDLVPYLGWLASGVDIAGATADVALGREPDLTPSRSRAAAVSMVYPTRDLRLEHVGLSRAPSTYRGLDRFDMIVEPGTDVRLPPRGFLSRIAAAVVSGADRAECEANRLAVEADVVVTGTPLDAP